MIVATAEDAAALLEPLLEDGSGRLGLLLLDGDRRLIGRIEMPLDDDPAGLPVRSIVADALRMGAQGIILGSRRPDSDPAPGEADSPAARALADSARAVGVRLLDHLIFAGPKVTSFRALGLL